jgi:hypothetical protein
VRALAATLLRAAARLWVRREPSADEELVVRDIVAGSDVVRRTAGRIGIVVQRVR